MDNPWSPPSFREPSYWPFDCLVFDCLFLFLLFEFGQMSMRPDRTPHFQPLLNETTFGGHALVDRTLYSLGCFNQATQCPNCHSSVKFEISTTKKINDEERVYVKSSLRCCKKNCRVHVSLFEKTIWKDVGERILFVFVVGAFINRWSTTTVAAMTGSREDTISKYLRLIKNAIHVEVEATKKDMVLGESGRVQIDESHVFTRKYGVGRVPGTLTHGWVFGIIEDNPFGRLFIMMVKLRNRETLEKIIYDHVQRNTMIFSDSWSAYQHLRQDGYQHYQVNHKKHFIEIQDEVVSKEELDERIRGQMAAIEEWGDDAEDTEDQEPERVLAVNTQRIERAWREVKRGLVGQPLSLLRRNLNVEMFRFNNLRSNMSFEEKRNVVLRVIGKHQAKIEELNKLAFSIYDEN